MTLMGNADRIRLKGLVGLVSIQQQIQAAGKRFSLILIGNPKLAATIATDSALSKCFLQQYHLEPSV